MKLNKIMIAGNVVADLRENTFSNATLRSFTVGLSKGTKQPDGTWKNEESLFITCQATSTYKTVYEKMGRIHKGDNVFVEGELKAPRIYKKLDGTQGVGLNVNVKSIEIINGLETTKVGGQVQNPAVNTLASMKPVLVQDNLFDDNDLPF